MNHSVPHDLEPAVARKVADRAFESYRERFAKYDPRATWISESRCEIAFSAKGLKVKGLLELKPGAIEMDIEVPFLLRLFKSQAIQVIESEIRKWIAKTKDGEI